MSHTIKKPGLRSKSNVLYQMDDALDQMTHAINDLRSAVVELRENCDNKSTLQEKHEPPPRK